MGYQKYIKFSNGSFSFHCVELHEESIKNNPDYKPITEEYYQTLLNNPATLAPDPTKELTIENLKSIKNEESTEAKIEKKIKYYKGTDDPNSTATWVDLTINGDGVVDKSLQENLPESAGAKVSIGTKTNINGILVLEDNNKGMILPMVDKYSSIINPTTGTMIYDTTNNMICFFNGTVWTFWKTSNI